MLAGIVCNGYDARFGFAQGHWFTILHYADQNNIVLLFRAGKQASIPWIEAKFPAKSMDFKKSKVDKEAGLLIAKDPEQVQEVAKAGHWILRKADGAAGDFDAYDPNDPRKTRQVRVSTPWARENLVIDSRRQGDEPLYRPFTSDYDLAAIVPQEGAPHASSMVTTASPGKVSLTRPQVKGKGGLSQPALDRVAGSLMDPKKGYVNPTASTVQAELNVKFGSPRIMHGPQALYSKPGMGSDSWALTLGQVDLASGDDETIVAFCPGNQVSVYYCRTQSDSRQILVRHLPTFGRDALSK